MLTLQVAIILLLILLNGFFAMAEIAIVSSRPARLQPMAAQGSTGAEAALELKSDPSRLLATVQIGITVIAVLSGTVGEATLGDALQRYLAEQGGILARYSNGISMAVVVVGISYLSIVFGELVPKRIALLNPERISAAVARFMRGMASLGAPLEWLLSASSDLVLRALRVRCEPPLSEYTSHTRVGLRTIPSASDGNVTVLKPWFQRTLPLGSRMSTPPAAEDESNSPSSPSIEICLPT